jgi:hypothetical protein
MVFKRNRYDKDETCVAANKHKEGCTCFGCLLTKVLTTESSEVIPIFDNDAKKETSSDSDDNDDNDDNSNTGDNHHNNHSSTTDNDNHPSGNASREQ